MNGINRPIFPVKESGFKKAQERLSNTRRDVLTEEMQRLGRDHPAYAAVRAVMLGEPGRVRRLAGE